MAFILFYFVLFYHKYNYNNKLNFALSLAVFLKAKPLSVFSAELVILQDSPPPQQKNSQPQRFSPLINHFTLAANIDSFNLLGSLNLSFP